MINVTYSNKVLIVYRNFAIILVIPINGRDPIKMRQEVVQIIENCSQKIVA